MKPINIHSGRTVPLMNDNIDTDQIIPKSFLKRITKTGFGQHLFDEWRFLPDKSENPDFILNVPEYKGATVLVTGDNFGCGSSREHAAWALQDFGFQVIVAGGYSDIFYMNAIKNGLLPITQAKDVREKLAQLPSTESIEIDLPNQQISCSAGKYSFDIDPTWKNKLVKGLDDIALTLEYEAAITEYEKRNASM